MTSNEVFADTKFKLKVKKVLRVNLLQYISLSSLQICKEGIFHLSSLQIVLRGVPSSLFTNLQGALRLKNNI